MNIYYVYQYLREDGTPYYIGKGKNRRAWSKNHSVTVPSDNTRIQIIKDNLSEEEAFLLEIELISKYGRKIDSTGILRNKTQGGDNFRDPIVEMRRLKSTIETSLKLVKQGRHNFQTDSIKNFNRIKQQNLAKEGKHNFSGLNSKRLQDGTHNFLTSPSPSTIRVCCIKCKNETSIPGLGSHKGASCPPPKTEKQKAYQSEYKKRKTINT